MLHLSQPPHCLTGSPELSRHRPTRRRSLLGGLLLLAVALSGCANGDATSALERSLAPDPQLQTNPSPIASPTPTPSPIASPSPSPIASPIASPPVSPTTSPSPIASTIPSELQPYWQDWTTLGSLSELNAPDRPVTRRQFARWLVQANNQLFANRPAWQVRSATASSPPAFADLPASDRDFASIQGLAEAGIIPSSLTGNATAKTFDPDAPLTREILVLWKVPLDLRQPLAPATVESVQKAWGFMDSTKVDAQALRAIAADRTNGELSNIRRVFGFTTLLQPKKPVTQAEAAAALWYFGPEGQGITAKDLLNTTAQPSPAASGSPAATPPGDR